MITPSKPCLDNHCAELLKPTLEGLDLLRFLLSVAVEMVSFWREHCGAAKGNRGVGME